jgi:enoyl-CoA hydratase/carnithine racemase
MTTEMWEALPSRIAELDCDPDIRVIVVTGDGDKAFVSGADASQFGARRSEPAAQRRYNEVVEAAYLSPARARKPVLAQIRGICFGGGLGLAAACDLRICAEDARFRMPAGRLGLGYSHAGVHRFVMEATKSTINAYLCDPTDKHTADAQAAIDGCNRSDDYREGVRALRTSANPSSRAASLGSPSGQAGGHLGEQS